MALSDLITPRIIELGKIKIGGKGAERKSRSGGTYRVPEKYDHFLVTTLQRDPKGDFVPDRALMESLTSYADPDGKLRQLPVAVLSNDIEDVMQASYVWYQGKRVAGRSDGQTLTLLYDRKSLTWLDQPREVPWESRIADLTDDKGNLLFKLHVTLNVVITAQSARWGGYYKFRTTSQISASQLYGSLLHIKSLTGGMLRGLPLVLVLRPMQVAPDGKTTTVYVAHVELRGPDLAAIQEKSLERARFELSNKLEMERTQAEYKRLLAPPGYDDLQTEADAAEEFHPEVVEYGSTPTVTQPIADPLASRLAQTQAQTVPAPVAVTSPVPGMDRLERLRDQLFSSPQEWEWFCGKNKLPPDTRQWPDGTVADVIRLLEDIPSPPDEDEDDDPEREAIQEEGRGS